MLGAAEPDALRAEVAGAHRVVRVVAVRPDLQAAEGVGPAQQFLELAGDLGIEHRHLSGDDIAGGAVDGEWLAFLDLRAAGGELALDQVDLHRLRAGDAGLAHASRDHRRVRGATAARGEHALGGDHAVHVVRVGLDAHEDDLLAFLGHRLGAVRVENGLAVRRARRGGESGGEHVDLRLRVDAPVQQLIHLPRFDAQHRLALGDETFANHVDGDLHGRLGGALAAARLEHVERAALDRELHVLHVAVVLLELAGDLFELPVRLGEVGRHRGDRLRRADARDDIFTLRVGEVFAVQLALAGRRVTRECNAGAGVVAHVAEDHRLHVDRGAEVMGDVVVIAVVGRTLVVPRLEHGADRRAQLLHRILGESRASSDA